MKMYSNLVAGKWEEGSAFFSTSTGEFAIASQKHVDQALEEADRCFDAYCQTSLNQRIELLLKISENLTAAKETIIAAYRQESNLPEGRAAGEFGRTLAQIGTFIALLTKGDYLQASIFQPNEGAELRKMMHPIGPVAVFGASNFPLAFSTAGGDTISALAAGCPVIVKAHPYHPLTSYLVAKAIQKAITQAHLPQGIFAHLQSDQHALGKAIVEHSLLKGVGFTGSFSGGKALYDIAQKRPIPIPVFAEMGSINPIVVFPGMYKQVDTIKQLGDSITLGAGQFCTNPGLLIALGNKAQLDELETRLSNYLMEKEDQAMVHENIAEQFQLKLNELKEKVMLYGGHQGALAVTSAAEFLANKQLSEEVFGPYSILVRCENRDEVSQVILSLDGQLTLTFLGEEKNHKDIAKLIPLAQQKVGRILFQGVPTGVAVTQTMTHGGPYPASTDSRFTAVGTDAIYRWLRPVSYQDCPNSLLPPALQDANPWKIPQKRNGDLNSPES